MSAISIYDIQRDPLGCLRRVEEGETLIVFRDDRALAEIKPIVSVSSQALPSPPSEYLPQQREFHHIAGLPIEEAALTHLGKLPRLHRDPFDRILVAQAQQHDLTMLTVDDAIRAYPVKVSA